MRAVVRSLSIVFCHCASHLGSLAAAFRVARPRGAPSSGSFGEVTTLSRVRDMNVSGIFVASATEGTDQPAAQRILGFPVHPGEDAAAKQEDDWWRVANSVLSNADAMHFIAGTNPHASLRLSQRT